MTRRIVLAAGSGFLGRALAAELTGDGSEVVILTRTPRKTNTPNLLELAWDGVRLGPWLSELDGAHALVNLTGRSVDCRYTEENRREIVASRLDSVRVLGQALARVRQPPAAFVQASSLAIYGDSGERVCEDDAPHGTGFSVDVCEQWECAFDEVVAPNTRKVVLRIGFVLGKGGGALDRLVKLVQAGLGGTVGSGKQYISWLHLADMNAVFRAAIDRSDITGTYNATGPNPVPNREFMRVLRRVLGRGWSPPAPSFAVRLGARFMGTEASLALTGRRCVPRRLEQQGFEFRFPELEAALRDVLA